MLGGPATCTPHALMLGCIGTRGHGRTQAGGRGRGRSAGRGPLGGDVQMTNGAQKRPLDGSNGPAVAKRSKVGERQSSAYTFCEPNVSFEVPEVKFKVVFIAVLLNIQTLRMMNNKSSNIALSKGGGHRPASMLKRLVIHLVLRVPGLLADSVGSI